VALGHPDPRWVAPPGKSLHRLGTELDLGPASAYGWLASNAKRFGSAQLYSGALALGLVVSPQMTGPEFASSRSAVGGSVASMGKGGVCSPRTGLPVLVHSSRLVMR